MDGWKEGRKEFWCSNVGRFGACKLKTCVWQCSDSVLLPGTNEDYIKIHSVYRDDPTHGPILSHIYVNVCVCLSPLNYTLHYLLYGCNLEVLQVLL